MVQFSSSVYYWDPIKISDRPIIAYIKGNTKSLLFDAGNSAKHAQDIIDDLKKDKLPNPDYIVISHAHLDHWLGLNNFNATAFSSIRTHDRIKTRMIQDWKNKAVHERVQVKAEDEITEIMLNIEYGENRGDILLRSPDIGVSQSIYFDLGGIDCSFDFIGGNHSNDSSVLYVRQEKILFLGDILYIHSYDKAEVDLLYRSIRKFDAEYYVDSHNPKVYANDEIEAVFREMQNPDYNK
jgi:glyoxylase-like metal-dependent hydrolase (beta-lactamase superfamily II)